jgi:hypothetical protein
MGQDEWSLREHLAASEAVHCNGDPVCNIEHNDRGRYDRIECTVRFSSMVQYYSISWTHLEEPRKIHPKIITEMFVKYSPLRGTLSFGCTLLKKGAAGSPPSLYRL